MFDRACLIGGLALALVAHSAASAKTVEPKAKTKVVTLERSDASLYGAALAGRYAQVTNNPELAAQAWTRAFMRRPDDAQLFARAIAAQLQVGDMGEALRLAKLLPKGNQNEDASLVLAIDALAQRRYKEANQILAKTAFEPSRAVFANHLQAYAALGQNKPAQAVEATGHVTGTSALDAVTTTSRALILDRAKRPAEAEILFQSAIAGRNTLAADIVAYGDWLVTQKRAEEAKALFVASTRLGGVLGQGFATRVAELDAAKGRAPAKPTLQRTAATGLLTIAKGLSMEGRGGSPAALLALVHHLDPSYDLAALSLAEQWISEGRTGPALPLLARIGPNSPDFVAARNELAWATFKDDPANAVAIARETARLAQDNSLALRLLADVLAANRQDGEALPLYTRLIDQGLAQGQTGEELWPLYFGRGGARERLGQWPEALTDLRAAKAAAPKNPNVLNYLGYSLADRGQELDEAVAILRMAVRLRPDSGAILDSLGWALLKSGKDAEAVAVLEAAAQASPELAEVSDHLGDAYWSSGHKDEARLEWARALRLSTDKAQTDKIAQKLKSGLPASKTLAKGAQSQLDSARSRIDRSGGRMGQSCSPNAGPIGSAQHEL
ncbi:MAG: hypothetical protein RL186_1180, partial [Pseudomonadota bacterium]